MTKAIKVKVPGHRVFTMIISGGENPEEVVKSIWPNGEVVE